MKDTLTLDLAGMPPEAVKCSACLERLGERLNLVRGISSVELNRDRGRVVIALGEGAERGRIEETAHRIMSEVAHGFAHETLRVGGMDCPGCASEVQAAVGGVTGVKSCSVDFASARMSVEFELGTTDVASIRREVRRLGFSASPLSVADSDTTYLPLVTLAVGGLLWLSGWLPLEPSWLDPLLFVASAAVSGWRMLVSGFIGLVNFRFSTNTLMTVAVIGALAIGEWKEGSSVAWLFALGNYFQSLTMKRTRGAVKALLESAPRTAVVRRGGGKEELPVREVVPGDLVEVRPFSQIPVDGEVVEGESLVDNSSLTGETDLSHVVPGAQVLAGGASKDGFLLIRATSHYSDSTYARTLELIERGQASRAPQQEVLDRVTAWYTPAVLVSAAVFATVAPLLGLRTWPDGLHQAFWMLMVACPCALVISIPVAVVTALGSAGRMGALVKGGVHLEALSKVRNWVFDKTGTLSYARLELVGIEPRGITEAEALSLAGALAVHSGHPASRAVAHRVIGLELPRASNVRELAGQGIEAVVEGAPLYLGKPTEDGFSGLVLERNGKVIATFALAESPRAGAAEAIRRIRSNGATVKLISGDRAEKVGPFATGLGVTDVLSGVNPDAKAQLVTDLSAAGGVAMVGDGVNDTAALQRATVGIAMGAAGSDAAIESADIVLLNDDITNLSRLLSLSLRFRSVMSQNIAFSMLTKGILLAFGAMFVLPFWLSVVGDMGVSLLVTANALRLRQ
jgi:Cd2+/Zn2+-exporting ATPase